MTVDPLAPHEPPVAAGDRAPYDPEYSLHPDLAAQLERYVVTTPGAPRAEIVTPLTGGPIGEVPYSSAEDVERAFVRAREVQRQWRKVPLRKRAALLRKLHDVLLQRAEEGLDIVQLENGKSRVHAFDEIADVALNSRWVARRGPGILRDKRHLQGLYSVLTPTREVHHPKGVVGMIAPWNYPLVLTISDAIPAFMAGNAVVLKPDSQTPFCALWCADLMAEAGFPDGLLQIVYGPGAEIGPQIVAHADHVCFTGSTRTGKVVAELAAARLVSVSLELGGKNPVYVAADAPLDRAAEAIVRDCFSATGHACISMERLYVHEKVADEFLDKFVDRVSRLRLGAGLDYASDLGSITSQRQLDVIEAHVQDAVAKGAKILTGGQARPDVGPLFYEPTVLIDVPAEADCYHEETFGPLVSVYRVSSDGEAVRRANATEYGLNATVWSRDLKRAGAMARRIEAGTVTVNEAYTAVWGSVAAPMGGRKESGVGRRHGRDGILRFTEAQSIATQLMPAGWVFSRGGEFYSRFMTTMLRLTRITRYPWP